MDGFFQIEYFFTRGQIMSFMGWICLYLPTRNKKSLCDLSWGTKVAFIYLLDAQENLCTTQKAVRCCVKLSFHMFYYKYHPKHLSASS